MKSFFTSLILSWLSLTAFAQNTGSVKGKLVDSVGKQSLKDATISILDPSDSTLEVFGLAKEDGSFEVKNISLGAYLVNITFQGYAPFHKHITLTKSAPDINLSVIYLALQSSDLGNVTVTQSPISILHDTLQYNAGSFKTKPNAVVEDLLKKLPGVDVDKSGNVRAQGEAVQRILVDGKRFFGDDPKMATKNLPPDIVDKIQVFDDLSDQSKFTGFDDGNRVKTINITTKKDKRKGYFGKGVAGIGSDDRYDESFNLHRINGDQQLSMIGQANNVNKQNFTVQDFLGNGNGGGRGRGNSASSGGITTSLAGGLNYRDAWGKNVDVSGSYFYNNQRTNTEQSSFTRNLIPVVTDSANFNTNSQSSVRDNQNHRINLNLEEKFDSSNSLVFRPNISFQHSVPSSFSSTSTTAGTTAGPNGSMINQSVSNSHGVNSGVNISGTNLQLRHRFHKKGRTISLDIGIGVNTNNGEGYNYAVNDFYKPIVKTDTINQHYISTSNSFNISPTLSYTEPIAKNQMIELNYNYSHSHSNSSNNSYSFDNTLHGYYVLDSLYSNSYQYTNTSSRGTINYRIQHTKYNLSFGTGVQFTQQTSINTTKGINISNSFTNFTPTANFQYNFSRSKNLRINYTGRTGQPSITQLQPLTTTSDSINFQVGNPNLKPQFTHSLRLLYQSFDPITQHVFLVTLNASTIVNDIQSSIIQNANGGKTTTSVNLNGTYNVAAYVNYGFPLRNPKSNMNFTSDITYGQAQTLVDHVSNYTRNTSLSETAKWTTNLKNNFDMNLNAKLMYNIVRNSVQPASNTDYYSTSVGTEITYYSNSGWIIATDFDYTYNGNRSAGYNTSVPLLTPSIAKQFLKNKAGEIRLTVFDLLNQNTSVTTTASGNTIQDVRTNVLTRYAMLTFTYNLRQFAGKQQRMPSLLKGQRGLLPGRANGTQPFNGGNNRRRN